MDINLIHWRGGKQDVHFDTETRQWHVEGIKVFEGSFELNARGAIVCTSQSVCVLVKASGSTIEDALIAYAAEYERAE